MVKKYEQAVLKAVALCFKPYLKPEEAQIYCNLARTQFAKKMDEYGIRKNANGYYAKTDLDKMLSGAVPAIEEKAKQVKLRFRAKGF